MCGPNGFDIGSLKPTVLAMYEADGKIKLINEPQSFASGFTKREFVVTTAHDKYPQDLKFEVVKDKCALLDAFEVGQDVHVSFDIRGNEYNGKYYVNLSCWEIKSTGKTEQPSLLKKEPTMDDLRNNEDFDDDVPF